MTSPTSSDLTFRLVVQKPTQRVLFAEADRNAVNFLFSSFPASTFKHGTGSDGQTLVTNVFVPKEDSTSHPANNILEDVSKKLKALTFEGDYGSVTQPIFYVITGDLVFKMWSMTSIFEILHRLNVVERCETDEVVLEATEFVRLVKMVGFECEDVLTSVFLAKCVEACNGHMTDL